LLKETTGAFDGARTHDWQVSTDHESDALRGLFLKRYFRTTQRNMSYNILKQEKCWKRWMFPKMSIKGRTCNPTSFVRKDMTKKANF